MFPSTIGWARFWFLLASIWATLEIWSYLKNKEPRLRPETINYFVCSAAIVLASATWLIPTLLFDTPIKEKVQLSERYPGEILGGSNKDKNLIYKNRSIIKTKWKPEPYKFTPMVEHGNSGITLTNLALFIFVPNTVIELPFRNWQPQDGNEENTKGFSTVLGNSSLDSPGGVFESLNLKFPNPGKYPISYAYTGIAIGGKNIMSGLDVTYGKFILELDE